MSAPSDGAARNGDKIGKDVAAVSASSDERGLEALRDVQLEVTVELGRLQLSLGELAQRLVPGNVLPLGKAADAPLEVRVHSRLIARAEAVAIGDRRGVRILEVVRDDGGAP
ncbi:MAG: FliM/FliN family flagellar motor switch protein [Kofleriaceae bacterium]